MSKIYIEEALFDLKKLLGQLRFVSENGYVDTNRHDEYSSGILVGIELCIKELENRLEVI